MYTSVLHPKDKRELQIKTGFNDSCNTYKVGDCVPFDIVKDIYGYGGLFDGIYLSYSDKGVDDYVVIKNHKVLAVRSKSNSFNNLQKQYKIKPPAKSLWTAKAYKDYVVKEKKRKAEYAVFKKSIKHLSGDQRLGALLAYPIRKTMGYAGIFRRLCKASPITSYHKEKP